MKYTVLLAALAGLAPLGYAAPIVDVSPLSSRSTQNFEPMRIEQREIIAFPNGMAFQGITKGEVQLAVSVDADGNVTDLLPTAYTKKPFADEAVYAARRFKYTPAKRNGVAHPTVTHLTFEFSQEGSIISRRIDEMAEVFLNGERPRPLELRPYTMKELDRIPTPKNVISPFYSKDMEAKGIGGSVLIEFYIDQQGKVRMPTILSAQDEVLGMEAIAAVRQWEFEPPTSRGNPVLVKANQEFRFTPKAAGATAQATPAR